MGVTTMKRRKNIIFLAFILGIAVSITATSIFADDKRPIFPINEDGLTYGSDLGIEDPKNAPDLISVIATNGKEGYAYKAEIDEQLSYKELEALSEAKIEKFKEAMEKDPSVKAIVWQRVPVYEKDGKTVIGEYVILYSPYLTYVLTEDGIWLDGLGNPAELDEKGEPVEIDIELNEYI